MRLNTANRSFFVLVGTALVPYALLGLFGCGVLSLVGYRLAAHGLSGLDRGGQDLRPAPCSTAKATYVGTSVNLAARVTATAKRHQFLVTSVVAAEIEGLDFEVSPAGTHALKGLTEPVELFEVRARGDVPTRTVDPVCGMDWSTAPPRRTSIGMGEGCSSAPTAACGCSSTTRTGIRLCADTPLLARSLKVTT